MGKSFKTKGLKGTRKRKVFEIEQGMFGIGQGV
jgi:hypothetical protein